MEISSLYCFKNPKTTEIEKKEVPKGKQGNSWGKRANGKGKKERNFLLVIYV